ncbi:MAG: hypothetical protein LBH62_02555 [Nitrososphaerota archaeon]|nr:hypothetical protein [Nitrososphaerota archaeon]
MSVVIDSMTTISTWITALWNNSTTSSSWTGFGQQFQGNGGAVTEAQWYGYKNIAAGGGTLVCKIYASLSAVQSGTPLATSNEINYNNLPASAAWFSFTFPTSFQTTSGQKYFIVITPGATLGTDYVHIYFSGAQRLGFEVIGREYGSWRVVHNSASGNSFMFKVLGTSSGGGSGGCDCDWNDVPFIHLKGDLVLDPAAPTATKPNVLEILNGNPYEFKDWDSKMTGSIVAYLRSNLWTQIGHDWSEPKSAALKFTSLVYTTAPEATNEDPNQKFSVYLSLVNFGVRGPNAGIACSRHFIVRKDFILNGMIDCAEGAIVLHAGKYRLWGGTQANQPTKPTIFSGGNYYQDNFDTDIIEFRRFGDFAFIPIRCSGLRDSNDNLGANGQVLTNTNSGLLWQNAVNVTSRIEKGQVQTNSNGDDIIVNFSPAFTNQPIITTGCLDASARSISVTITSLAGQPMNDLRAGFRIHASIATNASHTHKQMTVGTRTTLPSPNPANMIRSANIGDIEAVLYSIGTGGNGNTHDVNTDSATVNQTITRVPNLTLHYIAIGT